jgi:DNA replication protein DnaC
MSDTPQVLLTHHLKALKLPTFLREYDKVARQCAAEGTDYPRYLLRLAELELIDRERRMVERRIKAAKFPTVKSLDSFDFAALPSLNKALVMELARSEYVERRENIIAVGNSGTGKSHIALGLGLAACQKGLSVGFTTAAALVHELIEARDEKRLLRLQRQLASYKLLIIDELGYVPLSQTGAELLFEVFSQRYERGATIVTSNLPFDEWTSVFGSERLTGALLDRLTHHVHILEMNGESYRLAEQASRQTCATRYVVRRDNCKLTKHHAEQQSRIAAATRVARCALSPSSPAPAARRYAATGLDRSARPSNSAIRAANDPLRCAKACH